MLALFSSKAARSGCVVRRNVRDVEMWAATHSSKNCYAAVITL